MKIRTNNTPRPIVYGNELTGAQRRRAHDMYGFLGTMFDDARFVVYRGHVHYIGNFDRTAAPPGWCGAEVDGTHTATVIRLMPDGDTCVVGSAVSS